MIDDHLGSRNHEVFSYLLKYLHHQVYLKQVLLINLSCA
ncbi:hypothetical protein BTN49_2789 [Candidatus Enterovibrio escicola]|uniref:Uncharacterized protein n=1 Tax=Candidatus Enterovibrio escicola TaxID=1927127 RepID=A0A2A5T0J0_9GAMM|nr:hypothetical protein BTN49_2789 [Candidatus Enterovibrio escacola]